MARIFSLISEPKSFGNRSLNKLSGGRLTQYFGPPERDRSRRNHRNKWRCKVVRLDFDVPWFSQRTFDIAGIFGNLTKKVRSDIAART